MCVWILQAAEVYSYMNNMLGWVFGWQQPPLDDFSCCVGYLTSPFPFISGDFMFVNSSNLHYCEELMCQLTRPCKLTNRLMWFISYTSLSHTLVTTCSCLHQSHSIAPKTCYLPAQAKHAGFVNDISALFKQFYKTFSPSSGRCCLGSAHTQSNYCSI